MCSVLIVDDNSLSRRLTRAWLQRMGQQVDEVVDGASALQRLGIGSSAAFDGVLPEVILLDMVLPDTDGWSVLRAIRDDRRLDGTRVYCYSGTVPSGTDLPGFDGTIAKSGSYERFSERYMSLSNATPLSRSGVFSRQPEYGDASVR